MKLSRVLLIPFVSSQNKHTKKTNTFPQSRRDSRFQINCRKALASKKNSIKLPEIQINLQVAPKKQLSTERPDKIQFIKQVQRQIKLMQNRRRVSSLMRCHSQQQKNMNNTKCVKSLKFIPKAHLISNGSTKQSQRPSVSDCPTSQDILAAVTNNIQNLPRCKVGRVKYRVLSKPQVNYWDNVKLSQIQIRQQNNEQIQTLQKIQIQLQKY